jgi:hypothetical protein
VLAVACDELIGIQTPDGRKQVKVRDVEALRLYAQDWQRLSMSQGTKGPRSFDWVAVPILHKWEDDGHHWLLIRRCMDDPSKKTYYLVFAPEGTTLQEMVEAIGARWYIEQDARNVQRPWTRPLRSQELAWLVSSRHPRDAGSCLLDHDL